MLNYITIHGRLTRDPELKSYTTSKGDSGSVCNFSVAVDKDFGDGADFFDCKMFGKRGEAVNKFFSKGKEIVVSGSMHCEQYTDKNGNKRYPWRLTASSFDFCGSRNDNGNQSSSSKDFEEIPDDDIPF